MYFYLCLSVSLMVVDIKCTLSVSSKTTTHLLILRYATFTVNLPHSLLFVVILCMKLYILEFVQTLILR